ncbi:MAG TPA: hypothetical protein VMZ31_02140 [Phycisphaerae bacterium]|nr:hypothetical protein [Phycisphaerae bacterium]
MQGRIAWFQLETGDGFITTDSGEEIPFRVNSDHHHLHGGDLVGFEAVSHDYGLSAQNLRLLQKGIDSLREVQSTQVRQFLASFKPATS